MTYEKVFTHANGDQYTQVGFALAAGRSRGSPGICVYKDKDGLLWYRSAADFDENFLPVGEPEK